MHFKNKAIKPLKSREYILPKDFKFGSTASEHTKRAQQGRVQKRNPEDFIVKEIIKLPKKKKGNYLYVELKKTNRNTLDVLQEIAKKLNIPERFIGFSGNKDKNAVTTQYISIFRGNPKKISELKLENTTLKPLHFGQSPVYLGAATGNYFKISKTLIPSNLPKNLKIKQIVNYYGEQRFSENNADIGKAILQKDYQKACNLINNEKINNFLKNNNQNYKEALKTIQKNLLQLYINAFQSYLWNEVAKQFIKDNFKNYKEFQNLLFIEDPKININIPLISFNTFIKQKNLRTYYNNLLKKENITQEDYYLEDFPELVQDTKERPLFIEVKNLRTKNNYIEFILPSGAFATIVLRHIQAFSEN